MSVINELIRFTLSRPTRGGNSTVSVNSRDSYNNEVSPDDGIYREGSSNQFRGGGYGAKQICPEESRRRRDGFYYSNLELSCLSS